MDERDRGGRSCATSAHDQARPQPVKSRRELGALTRLLIKARRRRSATIKLQHRHVKAMIDSDRARHRGCLAWRRLLDTATLRIGSICRGIIRTAVRPRSSFVSGSDRRKKPMDPACRRARDANVGQQLSLHCPSDIRWAQCQARFLPRCRCRLMRQDAHLFDPPLLVAQPFVYTVH